MISIAFTLTGLLLVLTSEAGLANQLQDVAHEVEPKLVCYYTSWAKDRPDPWSYVSVARRAGDHPQVAQCKR